MKIQFISDLDVRHVESDRWKLIHPYYVSIEEKDKIYLVEIPQNFHTDFCSVPRLPFAYLLFAGMAQHAGVLHDALYSAMPEIVVREITGLQNIDYSRMWADKIFLAAMKHIGVSLFHRQAMYWAVRARGWRYFKKRPDDRRK